MNADLSRDNTVADCVGLKKPSLVEDQEYIISICNELFCSGRPLAEVLEDVKKRLSDEPKRNTVKLGAPAAMIGLPEDCPPPRERRATCFAGAGAGTATQPRFIYSKSSARLYAARIGPSRNRCRDWVGRAEPCDNWALRPAGHRRPPTNSQPAERTPITATAARAGAVHQQIASARP